MVQSLFPHYVFQTIKLVAIAICFNTLYVLSVNASNTTLDELFVQLKNAPSEYDARLIEEKIWLAWMASGDEEIDKLMREALRKRRSYNFNGAVDVLNKIIDRKPNYSEAWNQRATVYFNQGKYEESLSDIAKTLELEPRHFGSLAGRAVIRMKQLKPALVRQSIIEALKYHPFLRERRMFPDLN